MRNPLASQLLLALALLAGLTAPLIAKPNVILILTDDQGYGDLSCHGNPVLKTPNMDALARQSIRLTDFHVSPMCTPTRGEVLTGQCAMRNGAMFVCQGRSQPHRDIPMLPQLFQQAGYATGHFGKWHLGDNYPYRPQDRGFDRTIHHGAWGITSIVDYFGNDYFDDKYSVDGQLQQFDGYCTDVWFNEAMKWMGQQAAADKPFFVYLPTNTPHSPLFVDEKYSQPYEGRGPVTPFFGMIANLDENLGRLMKFLDEKQLAEDTILIFMTDNGTATGGPVFNAGMRGIKRSPYDGGHRVPLFVRWPKGGLREPAEIGELTHSTDILPTMVDLCELPGDKLKKLDGANLAPILRGNTDKLADRKVVVQYNNPRKFNKFMAVLWNKWRLVGRDELYNIADDPGQQNNLFDQKPEIAQAMIDHYEAWYKENRPSWDVLNYVSIGVPEEPVTFLSSANWLGDYADNYGNIATGRKFGYWPLRVESSGRYEVTMYRWAKEANTPLNAKLKHPALPRFNARALPIAKAQLKIGEQTFESDTQPSDTHARFTFDLKKGEQPNLEATFFNKAGQKVVGAYFVYLKKLD